jgi:SH3-like domain-containing protein
MKRFPTATAGLALLLAATAAVALAAQMMSVQVRSGQLRDKPAFLSKVVCSLAYGDRVALSDEKGDWRKVAPAKGGAPGWMHVSALSEQVIILNPTDKDVEAAASSDELALAGKGFNKQVEDQYRSQAHLDYSKVDEMEKIVVPPNLIRDFLQKGGLGGGQ